ncbi:poly [ADP-ribose] polymerase tankyrase-2-like isoform X2 [Haliotis rufescens]|uniref:poly [ADP-ribose] polymerase tankyrase-2-like isoform X2 n=1 Tax=Haliotis rufescens TaxID=6454 RepID=UPI00201EF64E|nr:poly [ADP-ribose] polymerase tankyrase-2-like isoform X2 [Haliotis rufescens]
METADRNKNYLQSNKSGNSVHKPGTDLSEIVTMSCLDDRCDVLEARLQGISKSDINLQDTAGMTALHFAVAHKKVEAVNLLLDHGADINAADDHGFTPLFMATGRYADYDVALTLLQKSGIIVNCINYSGATPLHGAAHAQNPDGVGLLIRHGACTSAKSKDGTTPLDLAGDHMKTITALKTTRCVECGDQPLTGLKTCGQCQGPLYCSKECQRKHWKEGGHKKECGGFVWAEPYAEWVSTISHHNMSVSTTSTTHMKLSNKNITKERFVVKVQLPIGSGIGTDMTSMMVYNKNRSLILHIKPDHQQQAFNYTARKIKSEGFMGLKAFFWAELNDGPEFKVKVHHKKCAPFQAW